MKSKSRDEKLSQKLDSHPIEQAERFALFITVAGNGVGVFLWRSL